LSFLSCVSSFVPKKVRKSGSVLVFFYVSLPHCARDAMSGAPSLLSPLAWDFLQGGRVGDGPSMTLRRAVPLTRELEVGAVILGGGSSIGRGDAGAAGRRGLMQKLARAKATPPKFITAVGDLVKGAPSLCPSYSANPLLRAALLGMGDEHGTAAKAAADDDPVLCGLVEPQLGAGVGPTRPEPIPTPDDDGARIATRWVRDARRLCDWTNIPPQLDVAHSLGGQVPADRGARKRQQILNITLFVAPLLVGLFHHSRGVSDWLHGRY
jgi:hypothetical protein